MASKLTYKNTVLSIGDTVNVSCKVKEGEKERIQIFKGIIISFKGSHDSRSFTVRKIGADKIGVERIWPIDCPSIAKIEVVQSANVRRAKLYYIRGARSKDKLKVATSAEEENPDQSQKSESVTK